MDKHKLVLHAHAYRAGDERKSYLVGFINYALRDRAFCIIQLVNPVLPGSIVVDDD